MAAALLGHRRIYANNGMSVAARVNQRLSAGQQKRIVGCMAKSCHPRAGHFLPIHRRAPRAALSSLKPERAPSLGLARLWPARYHENILCAEMSDKSSCRAKYPSARWPAARRNEGGQRRALIERAPVRA